MERQLMSDFVVETKGHCFLCLSRIHTDSKSEASPLKINSIQCLSRYLKTDMSKVFVGEGPIPPHLLAMLQKSQLKVELCEECFSINKRFLKLYRQLEKVELEMKSYVEVILSRIGKEADTDAANKTKIFRALAELDESFGTGKFQVVEALRQEISENCSQKLENVYPKVPTANLTMGQVNNKKRKIKCNGNQTKRQFDIRFGDNSPSPSQSACEADSVKGYDIENVKLEHSSNNILLDGNENSNLEEFDFGMSLSWEAPEGESSKRQKTMNFPREVEPVSKNVHISKPECVADIPLPVKLAGKVEYSNDEQYHKDPSTGKYICRLCKREYSSGTSLQRHFKSLHLKVRFKCETCGNEFSQKKSYDKHYMNVHIGVRYKCRKCGRVFTQKENLETHQKTICK